MSGPFKKDWICWTAGGLAACLPYFHLSLCSSYFVLPIRRLRRSRDRRVDDFVPRING